MLRNQSKNAMQLQITTTALQIERPNGDLPRNYPFSCALQKETDNDKSRLVQMLALPLGFFLPKQQVSEDTRGKREGRREGGGSGRAQEKQESHT